MRTLDDFISTEKPITGMTDQACDTYSVHSHAFKINLLGDGITSTNAGHFHVIRNGRVVEITDDAQTMHGHHLLNVQQSPGQSAYGMPNPLERDANGVSTGTNEYGEPKSPKATQPTLFMLLKESVDSIMSGDPSLVWAKLTSQATLEETEVLECCLDKVSEFREKMNLLIDELLADAPDRCRNEIVAKIDGFGKLPLPQLMVLSNDDISSIFGQAAGLYESQYSGKIREYMGNLKNELQTIMLLNEGKTFEEWVKESGYNETDKKLSRMSLDDVTAYLRKYGWTFNSKKDGVAEFEGFRIINDDGSYYVKYDDSPEVKHSLDGKTLGDLTIVVDCFKSGHKMVAQFQLDSAKKFGKVLKELDGFLTNDFLDKFLEYASDISKYSRLGDNMVKLRGELRELKRKIAKAISDNDEGYDVVKKQYPHLNESELSDRVDYLEDAYAVLKNVIVSCDKLLPDVSKAYKNVGCDIDEIERRLKEAIHSSEKRMPRLLAEIDEIKNRIRSGKSSLNEDESKPDVNVSRIKDLRMKLLAHGYRYALVKAMENRKDISDVFKKAIKAFDDLQSSLDILEDNL